MEQHEAIATSAKPGETAPQQKQCDFNHKLATAPCATSCPSCKPRWLSKGEHGLVLAKSASTLKPAPLPIRHDIPKTHQDGALAMVQARSQGRRVSLALPRSNCNVTFKDVAGELRKTNEELPADKGNAKVKPEQSYFDITKGLFRTQAINESNIPFAFYTGDNEDDDMAVNPCVVTAAVALIFLTIFLIFFLVKSTELLAALERTTVPTEQQISIRPRGFEATGFSTKPQSASDRYSASPLQPADEVLSTVETVDALTEATVLSFVTNRTNNLKPA